MGKLNSEKVRVQGNSGRQPCKLRLIQPPKKIIVKISPPVGGISVFTLIRTDTTLDLSQKAEKV